MTTIFNPANTFDVKTIWNALGTFYTNMTTEDKSVFESYWKSLFNGMEGLYYDLSQYKLSTNLTKSDGYIEYVKNEFYIDPLLIALNHHACPNITSISPEYTTGIIYNYYVTGINIFGETLASAPAFSDDDGSAISITYSGITGIDYYNIYRKHNDIVDLLASGVHGTTYTHNGEIDIVTENISLPKINTALKDAMYGISYDQYYMSMPTLSGVRTHNILTEGEDEDYVIVNGRYLQFKKLDNIIKDTYISDSAIAICPILYSLYFPALGSYDDIYRILTEKYYTPYLSAYEGVDTSFYDNQRMWCKHLMKWVHALYYRLVKGPSLKNLTDVLHLYLNVPFSYEDGIVKEVTADQNFTYVTISGNLSYTYKIPDSLYTALAPNDSVKALDLLVNEITISDYINNAADINAIVTSMHPTYSAAFKSIYAMQILLIDIHTHLTYLNYDKQLAGNFDGSPHFIEDDNKGFFENAIVPPNLIKYWNFI